MFIQTKKAVIQPYFEGSKNVHVCRYIHTYRENQSKMVGSVSENAKTANGTKSHFAKKRKKEIHWESKIKGKERVELILASSACRFYVVAFFAFPPVSGANGMRWAAEEWKEDDK